MLIDRKLSSVIVVIEQIYHPMAQDIGTSLSLRNLIGTEIQFSPKFFINLIQITGNLVTNAFKFSPSNGKVEVVFNLEKSANQRVLLMSITYIGNSIPHDLVLAFNQGKEVSKSIEAKEGHGFANRLLHVMQIVSKENGSIYMENGNDKITTFSLRLPISDRQLN